MRQLDKLWEYQQADKKVADYETEIRQFPLRVQLLKLRNIVADQQTVVRGMENDANKALERLRLLSRSARIWKRTLMKRRRRCARPSSR